MKNYPSKSKSWFVVVPQAILAVLACSVEASAEDPLPPGKGWALCAPPAVPNNIPMIMYAGCEATGGGPTDTAGQACTAAQSACTNNQSPIRSTGNGPTYDEMREACSKAGGQIVSGSFSFSNGGKCNALNLPGKIPFQTDQACKAPYLASTPCWVSGTRSVACYCPPPDLAPNGAAPNAAEEDFATVLTESSVLVNDVLREQPELLEEIQSAFVGSEHSEENSDNEPNSLISE